MAIGHHERIGPISVPRLGEEGSFALKASHQRYFHIDYQTQYPVEWANFEHSIVNEDEITTGSEQVLPKNIYKSLAACPNAAGSTKLYWWLVVLLSYDVDDRDEITKNYLQTRYD